MSAVAESTAPGRLDSQDVAGGQLPRDLRRKHLPVYKRSTSFAVAASVRAARSVRAAFGKHGEPTVLEHPQFADDPVAPAAESVAARSLT